MKDYGEIDSSIALSFPKETFVLHYEREYNEETGNSLKIYYADKGIGYMRYSQKNIQLLEDRMDSQVIKIYERIQNLPDNDKKVMLSAIAFGFAGIADAYVSTEYFPEVLLTIGSGWFFYKKLKKAYLLNDLEKNNMIIKNKQAINERLKANRDFRYWKEKDLSPKAEEKIREKLITNTSITVNDGDSFTTNDLKNILKG